MQTQKYAIGYFANPGYNEYGNQSILHREIVCLEKTEGPLPSQASAWKRFKSELTGCQVLELKNNKLSNRRIRRSDIFVVNEANYLYRQCYKQ